MKKKLLSFLAFCLFAIGIANAQKIKIKKGIVYVDGIECLKVSSDANSLAFSNLDGDDIIYVKYITSHGITYSKVIFIEQELELSSSTLTFTKKFLVKKLIENNTLKNCMLDADRIEKFVMRYDEKVEQRW